MAARTQRTVACSLTSSHYYSTRTSESSGIINYISSKLGSPDALKGKKIVVLYHGSPYGKERIPIYELLSKKFGFEVQQIEVPHPGNEQQSQWLTIRRAKPDYVVLRGGA